jgi:hypothetical protein
MRLLFRATLALIGVCCAFSTSQAFWWHNKSGGHHKGGGAAFADESCAKGACGAPQEYRAETKEYTTTQYRKVVSYVPETVVQRVTTMVPVPRVMAPPAGCHGVAPGAGCHGVTAGAGCHGVTAGAGCHGAPGAPGSNWQYGPSERGGDGLPLRLVQLETRILNLETKITTLVESVNGFQNGTKTQDKATVTIPSLPGQGGPADAVPVGNSPPRDADPLAAAARAFKEGQSPGGGPAGRDDLLAAARAFKARQAGAQSSPASPAVGPTTATARLAAGSP